MIRCRACGHANEAGGSFCESCGVFLEWTGDVDAAPATPPVVEDDVDYGIVFRTDHATGESGSVTPPTRSRDDLAEAETIDLRSDQDVSGAMAVPPPPAGPPPPPVAGTRIDRPPPVDRGARTGRWDPPSGLVDGARRASAEDMRVIARPIPSAGSEAVDTSAQAPVRRARGVEVQTVAADEDGPLREGEDDEPALFGPSLPGLQRDFTPMASVRSAPTRTPQEGDVLCTVCGEANLPSREFCRRCGAVMAVQGPSAAGAAAPTWWQRLLRRPAGRRKDEDRRYRAGERPTANRTVARESRTRRAYRSVTKVGRVGFSYLVAVLAILALLATVLPQAAPVRDGVVAALETTGQRVQGFLVPQYVRVNPVQVTASSALPDQEGEKALDGFSNTNWTENGPGPGVGQRLVVEFQEPVDLAVIAVLNGGEVAGEEFISRPRPRVVALSFDDGTSVEVELRDEPDFQEHRIAAPVTQELTITILSVYEAVGGNDDASISEIEFLRRA